MIPKPDGGERELGVQTVTDRLIQQALLQVLQPLLDPTFSEHSYSFRPGRNAYGAILAGQCYFALGQRIVVDVDLEKFFDRVDHEILIDRLGKRIAGRSGIRLRAYLDASTMNSGVIERRRCGAPQGGPLSPLLANMLPDEVDCALSPAAAKRATGARAQSRPGRYRSGRAIMLQRVILGDALFQRCITEQLVFFEVESRHRLGLSLHEEDGCHLARTTRALAFSTAC